MNFDDYANYYSVFYREKDYNREAIFIGQLIRKYNPQAKKILDLGCGTGNHAAALAKQGYQVTGVDVSDRMLAIARTSHENTFISGDLRTVRLSEKFDVVISLFDVMSYQVSDADVQQAFATAFYHLKKKGVFIFDVWFGPAVENSPPVLTKKEFIEEGIRIERIASPLMMPEKKMVQVNLTVLVNSDDNIEEIQENHCMRYFFPQEMEAFGKQSGFTMLNVCQWHKLHVAPDKHSWKALFVFNKNKEKRTGASGN